MSDSRNALAARPRSVRNALVSWDPEYATGGPPPSADVAALAKATRNFILDNLTTQNSPAEWLARRLFPDYRSENTAGIYADNPDLGALATSMAGPVVYHMTSPTAARKIIAERRMIPKEDGLFFSNRKFGDASSGYGTAAVRMDIPEHLLKLDDAFPSGEQHFRVEAKTGSPTDVTEWLTRAKEANAADFFGNLERNWSAMPASGNPNIGKEVMVRGRGKATVLAEFPAGGTSYSTIRRAKLEDGTIIEMPRQWKGWE